MPVLRGESGFSGGQPRRGERVWAVLLPSDEPLPGFNASSIIPGFLLGVPDTFSLSGWAMPFLQRRPGLWQMLRLSPRTESPRSVCLDRVRRKTFSAFLLAGPISRPRRPMSPRQAAQDTDNLNPRLPQPALSRVQTGTERGQTELILSPGDEPPAAKHSAKKSLVGLAHSDKIHFIGFVLKFDIGRWDSNFTSRTITIAAGTFKTCVFLLFKRYIVKTIYVKHLIRERFSLNVNIKYNIFISR